MPEHGASLMARAEDSRYEGTIVPIDDGSAAVAQARTGAMALVISYADARVAAGAAVFGLGFLVLPLLAKLGGTGGSRKSLMEPAGPLSYRAHGEALPSGPPPIFTVAELRRRFGVLDAAFVLREIAMTSGELEDRLDKVHAGTICEEVNGLTSWREQSNGYLRLLRKRSALEFLGLPPDATEVDINKVYKKMAFELHPDKGGDPSKFQELQDMKERLAGEEDGKDAREEADGEAKNQPGDKCTSEKEKVPSTDDLRKARLDIHEGTARIYGRAARLREEISVDGVKCNPQAMLGLLRSFVQRFVDSEVSTLPQGQPAQAEKKFRRFIQKGAEVIAMAAVADMHATLATVSIHFNSCLVARCPGDADLKQRCALLLEAISELPNVAAEALRELDAAVAEQPERDRRRQAAAVACENGGATPVQIEPSKYSAAALIRERSRQLATIQSMQGTLIRAEAEEDPDLPVFEPPPISCAGYDLKLRMTESQNGLEQVRAELWDKGEKIGYFRGSFLQRGAVPTFAEMVGGASAHVRAWLQPLFDASGRPRSPLSDLSGAQAQSGGLLCIEDVFLVKRLRGRDLGLDFMRTVLRCLAGPIKRMTLAICAVAPSAKEAPRDLVALGAAVEALERHWARLGFRNVDPDRGIWFWEPRVAPRRQMTKADVLAGLCMPPAKPGKKRPSEGSSSGKLPRRKRPRFSASDLLAMRMRAGGKKEAAAPMVGDDFVCGQLTARAHYALSRAAVRGADRLRADAARFVDGRPGGSHWGSEQLPEALRGRVLKAFVKGMADIVDLMGALLLQKRVPTSAAVMQLLSAFTNRPREDLGLQAGDFNKHFVSHFFGKGGKVEHALLAVIDEASRFCEERENSVVNTSSDMLREYDALPIHMLDGDFEFVRSILLADGSAI